MKSLPGIIIGIAAGVALGVLIAPKSGKSTRKKIADGTDSFFNDLQDQLQDGIDSIKKQYNEFVDASASKAKDVAAKVHK
nr:YtxH domain-containing protein [uncultured Arsenicibacter sp.]